MRFSYKWPLFIAIIGSIECFTIASLAQEAGKPFTAAVETELSLFLPGFDGSNVHFSPDGNYFVVYSERGRLDLNRPESSLRFYKAADVQSFLDRPNASKPPAPVWVCNRSTDKEGPIIESWGSRWLRDSSGVAFLERMAGGDQRLVVADLLSKAVKPLTADTQAVQKFDVLDSSHFVYTSATEAERNEFDRERHTPQVVGTGRSLEQLLIPDDPLVKRLFSQRKYELWALIDGKRFQVKHDGEPIAVGEQPALSPDGHSIVTTLPVPEVPKSWETLYPPPFPSSASRIRAGHGSASQYVRIDLQTGSLQSLTNAPTANSEGWWTYADPSWSSDGQAILLPGTFVQKGDTPSRPCVAVVNLSSNTTSCVEVLKARTETGTEEGYHSIWSVEFVDGDKQRVKVNFSPSGKDWMSMETTEYRRMSDGAWEAVGHTSGVHQIGHGGLEVKVEQSIRQPPQLIASMKGKSHVIWDPNPQLKDVEMGEVSVYTWKDDGGREVQGGLYKPVNYKPGQRYPLVIQSHGFEGTDLFLPAGTGFPTGFAARQLAGAGFFVLQPEDGARGCSTAMTQREGPCAASAYESAARQLAADGLVDPEKVGLVGFSRSCFYVMEALTTSPFHFKAALITDGVMFDYLQYIEDPERMSGEANAIIGAAPLGEGLQQWWKRSPGFNLDKVNAPLMVVAEGPVSLLSMWGPYAGLHVLKKPVDLIMLNSNEHVLTNPAERIASQTGSVDWFRFWLQGYEDPDPAKAEQYKRWRELRKMQDENDKLNTTKATTN